MKRNESVLSEEEMEQLELLADGELDEATRYRLLQRLDQVQDGWRSCARAFLESQCFAESFAAPREEAAPEPLRAAPAKRRNSRRTAALISAACVFALAAGLGVLWFPRPAQKSLMTDSAERAYTGTETLSNSAETEPLKAKAPRVFAQVEKSMPSAGSMPGSRRFAPSAEVAKEESAPVSEDDAYSAAAPAAPGGDLVGSRGLARSEAADSGGSEETVRHILLKRPGFAEEGITIPCVESDSYQSGNSDGIDQLVKQYKDTGCRVETLHEELKFKLKDGKTLIVPVDTIDVRRSPERPAHANFL